MELRKEEVMNKHNNTDEDEHVKTMINEWSLEGQTNRNKKKKERGREGRREGKGVA